MAPVLLAILSAVLGCMTVKASPCPLLLAPAETGFYYQFSDASVSHTFQGFAAGSSGGLEYRNFLLFNIPTLTQTVVSAELWIDNTSISFDHPSETYELVEVTNAPAVFDQYNPLIQQEVFNDLGDGGLYGSRVFTGLDNAQTSVIPLNSDFLARLLSSSGGSLILGGHVSTLTPDLYDLEFIGGNSSAIYLALTFEGAEAGPLQFQRPPIGGSFLAGDPWILAPLACGVDPISYQWWHDGGKVSDATNSVLQFQPLRLVDAGEYFVVASNIQGVVTSLVAKVFVDALRVYGGPDFQTAEEGSGFNIIVQAQSKYPVSYEWFHNGDLVPAATGPLLSVTSATMADSGNYYVVVSNSVGVVTGGVFAVTIYQQVAYFYAPLPNQTVAEGATATFFSPGAGAPPPKYYWFFNGTPFPAPDGPELTLVNVNTNDAGFYSVVASNFLGAVTNTALLTVSRAGPLDHWTLRNPLPQPNDLLDVTYGNGLFVAVGINGALVTSTNGQDWLLRQSRTVQELRSVAYGAGQFVAVGDSVDVLESGAQASKDVILTSTNGRDWHSTYPGAFRELGGVTYGNGLFVVAGPANFLISSNALDWTGINIGIFNGYSVALSSVTFGNGLLVAAGYAGQAVVLSSTNGRDWVIQSLGTFSSPEAVRYAGGRFVLVGADGILFTSSDGSQWIKRNTGSTARLLNVDYGNNAYVIPGVRGTILRTTDLVHWTAVNSDTPDRLESIIFAQNKFTIVGESGTTLSSTDGITWLKQGIGTHLDLDGITTGDGGFIMAAGKSGTILTTSDGINIALANGGTSNDLHGVAFGTWREPLIGLLPPSFSTVKRYVAVGDEGTIVTSDDGLNWVPRNSPTNTALKAVTYGGSLFVAVGAFGTIVTSSNGIDWTLEGIPDPSFGFFDLNDVAYGNGVFVIATDRDLATPVSRDGHHWGFARLSGPTKHTRGITFGNGQFGLVGNDGIAWFSANGTNWNNSFTGFFHDVSKLFRNVPLLTHERMSPWLVVVLL